MERSSRRAFLSAVTAGGLAGVAGCLGGGSGDSGGSNDPTAWRTTELTDVLTGQTFTVEALPKPVLLETFAVWCSTCLRQQKQIRALHGRIGTDAVTSVTLNVDPNEDAATVRDFATEEGFDWRYAVSPPEVTNSLVDSFGETVTVPPKAPVIVVCEDGARRLRDGVKGTGDLESALDRGC